MPDIDIRNTQMETPQHCNKCGALITAICTKGISGIESLPFPCFYKADDFNKYLLQCVIECYKERGKNYIKPTIISDGKWDHYNRTYDPSEYELKDFIVSGDSNVYLVNGEAGIGKSTFLSELYYETSLYSLTNGCSILPILFRMGDFGSDNSSPKEWIRKQLAEKYHYLDFEPAFFSPEVCVVFFLDAVNDIQYIDYNDFKEKLDKWRFFIDSTFSQYTNIKFIISSRYLDYLSDFEIQNYTRLFIQPFDDMQVSLFIEQKNFDATTKKQFLETIKNNKELPFLRNPFFLNKLSTSCNKIKNRTDIINAFLNTIFTKENAFIRSQKTKLSVNGFEYYDVKLNGSTFFDALSEIAFINQKLNKLEITLEEIEKITHKETKQFIDLARNNSIFTKNLLKFTHPILQEYFAGRYIFVKLKPNYGIDDILILDDEVRLSQSIRHLYNFLSDKERIINLLLDNEKFTLAAECILEDMAPNLKYIVTNAIALHLEQYSNSIQESYNLGFLLGKLGDPRILSGLANDVIEPNVVTISTKTNLKVGIYPVTNLEYSYFINDGGYSKEEYWEGIDSRRWFDFDTRLKSICNFWYKIQDKLNSDPNRFFQFCMRSKFDKELIAHLTFFKTISKEDFELMIKDLYSEEKNNKPLMWDNPTYNNPSQPVIGISIYEALAYCCWLSKKTQKKYRLLTNEEWEMVSEATHKVYIYGNTINTSVSNTSEAGLKKIIPVGVCKNNISKDGVFDLTGNIYEWTSTVYRNETDDIFKQYICKGGSWIQDSSRAKSSYIGRGMGWVRNLDLGFRVCCDEN